MSMTQQEAREWLEERARKSGTSVDEGDIQDLARRDGSDIASVQQQYEDQYARRGESTSHRASDSQSGNYDNDAYSHPSEEPGYGKTEGTYYGTATPPPPQQGSAQNRSSSGIQSWLGGQSGQGNGGPDYTAQLNQQNDLLRQMFERQVAEQSRVASEQAARDAELKARRDALFGQLQGRAQQSLSIDPTQDPIIKGQVDNYRAEQERALRNVRSDAAEGGNALRPTQDRMATERVAQGVASMQSELMARELSARRAEIADALAGEGSMLGADQQVGLQQQLASLDNIIRQQQLGISSQGLDLERELGLGNLGLGYGRLGLDTELGRSDLALRDKLGMGGLSNDLLRTMLQNQQFYGDLGLRGRTQDDYYDLVRRGRIGNAI